VVDPPIAWPDGAVALSVHDALIDRPGWPALRVFVYADSATAAAAHRRAHAQEQARTNQPVADNDDRGPQLLSGYGASVWRRNVAIIQLSSLDDPAAFPVEPDCAVESAGVCK
jgi:hypothetical protein